MTLTIAPPSPAILLALRARQGLPPLPVEETPPPVEDPPLPPHLVEQAAAISRELRRPWC